MAENGHRPHEHNAEEWAELMARTVAHLAAQLTMTQVRLRALGTELAERGVDRNAVQARVRQIAAVETGAYLRENLGEALVDVIDVDTLEADIIAFLNAE
ncbi:MAG: hypothetical protein ACRDJW_16270 [Thermomicrobiales bacterium]